MHTHSLRWRSRPLLLAAAATGCGIVLAERFDDVSVLAWSIAAFIGLLLACIAIALPSKRILTTRRLRASVAIAVALVFLGAQRYANWNVATQSDLANLAVEADSFDHSIPLLVVGKVQGSITSTDRRTQFRLRADSVGYGDLIPTIGLAEVTIWQPRPPEPPVSIPEINPGDRVAVVGSLRPLPTRRNPADFDYGAHLRRRGVHAVVSSAEPEPVAVLARSHRLQDRLLGAARQRVRHALTENVPGAEARGVLEALLLADRSGVAPEVRATFARTGLAHLLAVSGLHVFLVGMVLYGLLKPTLHRLGLRWRTVEWSRAAITIVVLGSYVAVVGGPPSATRALVMASAFIFGKAMERPANTLNSLGAAAIVLLLIRPAALFDVGFQLSFAAVGGIVILLPVLQKPLPVDWRQRFAFRNVANLTIVSLAATLGTMPVLTAHFGVLPMGGVALNLVAIPTTAITLASGLLVLGFHGWAPALASAAGTSADLAARILLHTGDLGLHLFGWTAIDIYVTSALALACLVLAVATVALLPRPRHRWRSLLLTTGCAAALVWQPLLRGGSPSPLELIFFDVGQGDAVLVTFPNGKRLLYDAGPSDPFGDAGERVLLPHFERFAIRELDALVISHPHSDHLGGAPAVIDNLNVRAYYDNGERFESDLYDRKLHSVASRGVPLRSLRAGDALDLDPSVRVQVLHPGPETDAHTNDASVVLRITYRDVSILLLGDVEAEAERTLVARYGRALCSNVVKVAHHGSRTSSTEELVAHVAACGSMRKAVMQLARRNRYGHPSPESVERWRSVGATVVKTSREGAVWLRTDGHSVERVQWR